MRVRLTATVLALALSSTAAAQQVVNLPAADRVLPGSARNLYTVGVEEGRAEEQFTQITQVAFDRDDNLYLMDMGNHRVVVFDRNGRFVRSIGRRGGGPGELNMPTGMAITADGRLVIADAANGNLSVYERDGTFLYTIPVERTQVMSPRVLPHPVAGVLLAGPPGFEPGAMQAGQMPDMNSTRILWQQLQERTAPAPLAEIASPEGSRQVEMTQRQGGNQFTFRMPAPRAFAPQTSIAVLGDGGLAVTSTAEYEARILSPTGDHLRTIRRPLQPRRVTERDKEKERNRRLENIARGGGIRVAVIGGGGGAAPPAPRGPTREQQEEQVRNMEFAEVIPVIAQVSSDAWGRIWVARSGEPGDPPSAIDIVSPRGAYVGSISGQRLPAAFSASGRMAFVERDDLDVVRVRVAEMPGGWR